MTITIITVGKPHDPIMAPAIEQYSARLQHFAETKWRYITHAGNTDIEQAKKSESDAILNAIKPDDIVVLLDERGKHWDSVQFANQLERLTVHARGSLVFVIGGAHGVDARVFDRATLVWSLSQLVFPHQIARLLVAEQLYRAFSILHNLPYHHR